MTSPDGAETTACAVCGGPLRSAARFCSRCGTKVGAEPGLDAASQPVPVAGATNSWPETRPLIALYVVYLSTSLVLGLLSRSENSLTLTHICEGIDALATLGYCLRYRQAIGPLLAPRLPRLRAVFGVIVAGSAFIAAEWLLFQSLGAMGLSMLSLTSQYQAARVPPWAIYLSISVAPALWEELAFRGVIQTRLQLVLTPKEAWIVQAGLFAVLHLYPVNFITHFGIGLMLGWLRTRWSSLYPAMAVHAAWNALCVFDELGWTP